jgi:beta-glucosidase
MLAFLPAVTSQQSTPPYKNPSLPIDERVKDLLGRMTLEEKVAQMESTWQNYGYPQPASAYFVTRDGKLDAAKAKVILKNGLGEFRPPTSRQPTWSPSTSPTQVSAPVTRRCSFTSAMR